MSSRSSASILSTLILVGAGIFLGVGLDHYRQVKAKTPAPPPKKSPAPAPEPTPIEAQQISFFERLRFTGSLSPKGWKTAATWTSPHGSTVKLGSEISGEGVQDVNLALGYQAHGWSWMPNGELSAAFTPGKDGVRYSGRLTKEWDEGMKPALFAEVNNDGAALGASVRQKLTGKMDVAVDMKVPVSFETLEADPSVSAKTTYTVRNGKLVGTAGASLSKGLRGTDLSASYDLGA